MEGYLASMERATHFFNNLTAFVRNLCTIDNCMKENKALLIRYTHKIHQHPKPDAKANEDLILTRTVDQQPVRKEAILRTVVPLRFVVGTNNTLNLKIYDCTDYSAFEGAKNSMKEMAVQTMNIIEPIEKPVDCADWISSTTPEDLAFRQRLLATPHEFYKTQ
jgi:hypothetical protein